jgi:hypothetical protein
MWWPGTELNRRRQPFQLHTIGIGLGKTTAPCGVPSFVSDHWPSSDTPAFSHFRIRQSILRSATRCSMNLIVHSWLRLSKEARHATHHQHLPERVTVIRNRTVRHGIVAYDSKVDFIPRIKHSYFCSLRCGLCFVRFSLLKISDRGCLLPNGIIEGSVHAWVRDRLGQIGQYDRLALKWWLPQTPASAPTSTGSRQRQAGKCLRICGERSRAMSR